MKIVHTSDWHVGKTLRGRTRAPEHQAALAEIAGIVRNEQADLVLVAGDLFDSSAPAPEAERLVYQALLDLAATGATVLVLAGNHDSERRLQAVQPLLALGRVVARPLPSADAVLNVTTRSGEEARVAMLPWVGKHHLVRAEQLMNLDASEQQQEFATRIGAIVEKLCEPMTSDTVNILAAHMTIYGAEPGEEVRAAHVFDYSVAATIFPPSLHYVALGHFHKPQSVPAPCPAWYSGSPLWLGFGTDEEESQPKGVVVVEAEAGRPAVARLVPLASGRRLRTIRGTLDELESMSGRFGDDYLRVYVREQARAGIAQQVREWFPEAVDVTVDSGALQPATERANRRGRSPHELFVEYLTERNALDERVVGLFDSLLEEVHAADPA